MAKNSKILTRFWQELKRRKVFKVLAMYAGTAFIIFQVFDMLTAPLGLPSWILTLAVILLSIGFPVVAILAWIFDLTPQGIKKTESLEESIAKEIVPAPARRRLKAGDIVIAVLTIIVLVLAYPKIFQRDSLRKLRASDGRIPLAIIPFQNLSNDSSLNYLKAWIPESMTSYLSNFSEDFQVRHLESVYSLPESKALTSNASVTPSVAALISRKLAANIIISGIMTKTSTVIIVNANLINSKTEEVLKSFQEEGISEEIIQKVDTLSQKIRDYLIISKLKKGLSPEAQRYVLTSSLEALRHYILGRDATRGFSYNDTYENRALAHQEFLKAIKIDSNFTVAYLSLISSYANKGLYDSAKIFCQRLYNRRDQMTPQFKLRTEYIYSALFKMPYDCIRCLKQLLKLDDQQPGMYYNLGNWYSDLNQPDKAISAFEKSLEIYNKWGIKPPSISYYMLLGNAYYDTKQNKKEERILKKAEKDFPGDQVISWFELRNSLAREDTVAANDYLNEFITRARENSLSELDIAVDLGNVYEAAEDRREKGDSSEYLNKAEEYYRKAVTIAPDDFGTINYFIWFLINKDRNINEGMELIDKALKKFPDNWAMLDNKGWGFYKQGKYQEALKYIQKADSLKPVYSQEIYDHLEAVKKAIASQKIN